MKFLFKLVGGFFGLFLCIVFLTATISFIRHTWFADEPTAADHLRVVDVTGVILSSSSLTRELEEITENPRTKAVVVRINSPGGVVAPSQEIYEAVKKTDEKIPVVVSMGSVAASGGYYIALGGRKIFANPGTLTGSIGVIMEFLNTQKLYQWAKLDRFSITSGKFKDAGSPLKPMTPEDKALFQEMVSDIYAQFRGVVAKRRKIESPILDRLTDGRVLTGNQAFEAKLVDNLGGFEDAVAEAKKLGGLKKDAAVVYPEKHQGLLRRLLVGEEETEASWLKSLLGLAAETLPSTLPGPSWRILWLAPVH